jgi:hypothetical protein
VTEKKLKKERDSVKLTMANDVELDSEEADFYKRLIQGKKRELAAQKDQQNVEPEPAKKAKPKEEPKKNPTKPTKHAEKKHQ